MCIDDVLTHPRIHTGKQLMCAMLWFEVKEVPDCLLIALIINILCCNYCELLESRQALL